MNTKIANALSIYFSTLYELNKHIFALCGKCKEDYRFDSYKSVLDIIQDIPRLIPFCYDKKKQMVVLSNRNGLLEFQSEIDFLKPEYTSMVERHYDFIEKVRKIRNKAEHKMHAVINTAYGNGSTCLFDYEFNIEEGSNNLTTVLVEAEELIRLVRDLNILFSKIQNQVKSFAVEANKTGYPYYERLCRFDFVDFNKIYDSNLLIEIGNLFVDF
ncbi:MAG: hypothetical protein IJN34_06320 [Clostridia bacterium]|nr:hypothetical protein [Clostridia bacterium]